jgi:hypothetical protein
VELIREALKPDVVMLTKDLNGNHVIQKCLNKLEADDIQVPLFYNDYVNESSFSTLLPRNVSKSLRINTVAASFNDVLITRLSHRGNNSTPNSSKTPSACLRINLETTFFNIFSIAPSLN